MPQISVIVPVYKVEPYLHRCVDSILAQTFIDFELILVDDGSPDACPVICDEYAQKDSRVRVIHKENGGLSSARNTGLDVAKGEYVLFIDSDDYIDPETLEQTMAAALLNNADMVMFDYVEEYEDGTSSHRNANSFSQVEQWSHDDFWEHYYHGFPSLCVILCNKLCKKKLFSHLRFEVGRIHEDEFIIYDLIYNANKIVLLNQPFYHYWRRNDSIMGNHNHKGEVDFLVALCLRAKSFLECGYDDYARLCIDSVLRNYYDSIFLNNWSRQEKKYLRDNVSRSSFIRTRNVPKHWNYELRL